VLACFLSRFNTVSLAACLPVLLHNGLIFQLLPQNSFITHRLSLHKKAIIFSENEQNYYIFLLIIYHRVAVKKDHYTA
jgi:hypothetical protein